MGGKEKEGEGKGSKGMSEGMEKGGRGQKKKGREGKESRNTPLSILAFAPGAVAKISASQIPSVARSIQPHT